MAEYVVMYGEATPPGLGETRQVSVYRGDHASEDAAVEYVVAQMGLTNGAYLWADTYPTWVRYVATAGMVYSAAPG